MKRKITVVTLAGIAAFAAMAWAGQMWAAKCGECGYGGNFVDGGIMRFGAVNGACGTCRKIVTIKWERTEGDEGAPKPVVTVWDSARNRDINIYDCPHCKGHFIAIEDVEADLKHCPSCKAAELTLEPGPMAD